MINEERIEEWQLLFIEENVFIRYSLSRKIMVPVNRYHAYIFSILSTYLIHTWLEREEQVTFRTVFSGEIVLFYEFMIIFQIGNIILHC